MDGVSDAASLVTLVQLAAVIINYVKNVTDAPVQKRQLLAALVQARGLLLTLVELTNEVDDEDWSHTIQSLSARNGPLSRFQSLLEKIARKLDAATPSSTVAGALKRLRWPFDQTSCQEMIASLEQLKSHFLLAIANDHVRLSMAIRDELHEVHSQLTETAIDAQRRTIVSLSREQELIVNSLSLVNLSGKIDGDKVMKMRASTEWFLLHDDFRQWQKASPSPSTLVLTGLPGTGKSSICEVIRFFLKAWHQSEIDVCVAYCSFNFSQREELSESLVLSDIVQQVVVERPYLMEHVAALRVTGGPLSSSKSIDLICRARRDLQHLYLILDGLDECGRVGLDVVKNLLAIQPPLSILIATRPEEMIMRVLQDCVIIRMEGAVRSSDHVDAVKTLLEENICLAGYLDNDPRDISNAAKLLFEQSNGLFIYTTAMVKSLAQAETRAMFRARFESILHNRPSSLKIYELILDDVNHQPAELVTLAKNALKIIQEAAGPVSISQLKSALGPELTNVAYAQHLERDLTEEEISETLLSSCKGFVTSASEPSTSGLQLRLVHLSAGDFLKIHGVPG